MHHYADRCCINLDNWNIFQQHNWHNYAWFFCFHDDNENEAVEAHIPRHRDSKTKKPQHRDSKTKNPRHRETETKKPGHRDSKAFFQRPKSHDIEIPRLKNHDIEIPRSKSHDIEFQWNCDPYAPWYRVPVEFWPLCPLIHYRGDSLTHPMLITAFYIFDPKVTGSLVMRLGT